ncbi:hypothetical protein Tco_0410594 [Tanacetum coccineum]
MPAGTDLIFKKVSLSILGAAAVAEHQSSSESVDARAREAPLTCLHYWEFLALEGERGYPLLIHETFNPLSIGMLIRTSVLPSRIPILFARK